MSVRVYAPAKINLTLKVGRPRADGMHPLNSVVAFARGGEWLEAEAAGRLSLTMIGPFAEHLEADSTNLVLRAADALAAHAGIEAPGAALTLYKDYPVASGIGGGSSDAAAALKALNALWRLNLDEQALIAIARTLGADVPVCVLARAAYMRGIGETFVPFDLPPLFAVLINARKPLPTPDVYRRFDAMELGRDFEDAASLCWPDAVSAVEGMKVLGNDLTAPAKALMPEIGDLIAALGADPRVLYANMSGSGATVFALCAKREDAESVRDFISAANPSHWVRAVTFS